jgi:hypothetical protein
MKTIIALIIVSSLIAQNQQFNPYSQALGVLQPNTVIIAPLQPLGNTRLQEDYIRSLMIQQNAQAQINQAMANQALKQANPNYVPKDYIRTQQLIDALLNAK